MRKSKTTKLSKAKADKYFSLYIRLRDADTQGNMACITCQSKIHWTESDAGHFMDRRHKATRYDEQNVNGQCRKCNRFESGRQFEHGREIDLKYGAGTAEHLLKKSRAIIKANQGYYEEIAEHYKQQASEIGRSKGLAEI